MRVSKVSTFRFMSNSIDTMNTADTTTELTVLTSWQGEGGGGKRGGEGGGRGGRRDGSRDGGRKSLGWRE